jgi:RHS repeat-associated protein
VQNNILGVGAEGPGLLGSDPFLSTTYYTRDSGGGLVSQRDTASRQYYLSDALGSVVGLTDDSGTPTATYKYDPFGNSRGETGAVSNPWRFAGEHREAPGTGLYKVGARYYDPSLGRWAQADPVNQAGSLRAGNPYAYVADDPVNITDPAGTCIVFSCKVYHRISNAAKYAVDRTRSVAKCADVALGNLIRIPGTEIYAGELVKDEDARRFARKLAGKKCEEILYGPKLKRQPLQ